MRSYLFFIFTLMMLCISQSAECGIVDDAKIVKFVTDLLGREYWDSDWKIADKHGKPDDIVRGKGFVHARVGSISFPIWCHIRAKLDIVGFRNMSVINGTNYVDGNASNFAIVKHSATHEPLISMYNPSLDSPTYVGGVLNSITSNVVVRDVGNQTVATQTVTLKWYFIEVDNEGNEEYVPVTEKKSFSVSVESPETFTTRIPDVHVHITSYNRSVNPVTYIYIPTENHSSMKDVMISLVYYNGSNIARYDQTGWVMKNSKGTEYVEFVDDGTLPSWVKDDNQSTIDHCGRLVTVFGRDFNASLLNISLHTPYETRYVTNYTIDEVEGNAKVNVPMLKVILLIAGFIVAFISIVGVIKRRI